MPPLTDTAPASKKTISFRVPVCLERQLEAVAEPDGNPLSATIRRLVSLGLRAEQQAEDR